MKQRPPDFLADRAARRIGGYVAVWRKLQGLTQEQVAQRAGVSRGAVVRLEQGRPGIELDVLLRVTGAMNITDLLVDPLDPYESDLGRARADQMLPKRVRR